MNEGQKWAIEQHHELLVDNLQVTTQIFGAEMRKKQVLSRLEHKSIKEEKISYDRVDYLMRILATKEKGWSALIDFLKNNAQSYIADELEKAAKDFNTVNSSGHLEQSNQCGDWQTLLEFHKRQRNYLCDTFCRVRNPKNSHFKPLDQVCVDLQLRCSEESPEISFRVVVDNFLKEINESLLVITGPSQCGKSTIIKMICSAWSKIQMERIKDAKGLEDHFYGDHKGNENSQALSQYYIFHILLREVKMNPSTDLLHLALSQLLAKFSSTTEVSWKEKVSASLEKLYTSKPEKFFFLLDGLDECSDGRILHELLNEKEKLGKVLITSRPLSWTDFYSGLHFSILSLREASIRSYFDLNKIQENFNLNHMLKTLEQQGVLTPLLLLMVCSIPHDQFAGMKNLPKIYEKYIAVIWRKNKPQESFEHQAVTSGPNQMWKKDSDMIQVCRMAFFNALLRETQITAATLKRYKLSERILKFGFFSKSTSDMDTDGSWSVEFYHMSIQEFFAATYIEECPSAFPILGRDLDLCLSQLLDVAEMFNFIPQEFWDSWLGSIRYQHILTFQYGEDSGALIYACGAILVTNYNDNIESTHWICLILFCILLFAYFFRELLLSVHIPIFSDNFHSLRVRAKKSPKLVAIPVLLVVAFIVGNLWWHSTTAVVLMFVTILALPLVLEFIPFNERLGIINLVMDDAMLIAVYVAAITTFFCWISETVNSHLFDIPILPLLFVDMFIRFLMIARRSSLLVGIGRAVLTAAVAIVAKYLVTLSPVFLFSMRPLTAICEYLSCLIACPFSMNPMANLRGQTQFLIQFLFTEAPIILYYPVLSLSQFLTVNCVSVIVLYPLVSLLPLLFFRTFWINSKDKNRLFFVTSIMCLFFLFSVMTEALFENKSELPSVLVWFILPAVVICVQRTCSIFDTSSSTAVKRYGSCLLLTVFLSFVCYSHHLPGISSSPELFSLAVGTLMVLLVLLSHRDISTTTARFLSVWYEQLVVFLPLLNETA